MVHLQLELWFSSISYGCLAFEYLSVAMVVSAIRRFGRAILRVFDVRAHRLRAMHGLGTISVLLAVFFLLNGAGASEVRSETAYIMARKGAEFVPGEAGNHVRFLLDDMSIRHLDVCTAPAFLNAQDAARLSKLLGQTGKALTIGDSGAAIDVEVDASRAVPGSVRPNTLAVHTANGTTSPRSSATSGRHGQRLTVPRGPCCGQTA